MSTDITTVTQTSYDVAEQALITMIRATYPTLDLRRGTVIRDLLIRPSATVYAYNTQLMADLQAKQSLTLLAANPSATDADVNAILSNYGTSLRAGTMSSGYIILRFTQPSIYNINTGAQYTAISGQIFEATASYVIRENAAVGAGEIMLYPEASGTGTTDYYGIIPVTAVETGSTYNIAAGTALEPSASLYSFISATAYSDFSGGTDAETASQAISRLPSVLSYKALESTTSIDSVLRTNYPAVTATSTQGYSDRMQLRDKHNPFGIAVGSRVDIYARTFDTPSVSIINKTATYNTATGTYSFSLTSGEAPGMYYIKSVSEPGSATVAGSYAFLVARSAYLANNASHDIDAGYAADYAFSMYQTLDVTVHGIAYAGAAHEFKVEVYSAPAISELQAYVDDPATRNKNADYMVRIPPICLVKLNLVAYYSKSQPIDTGAIKTAVADYVNSRSFVRRLTRSELACIVKSMGVIRVDFTNGMTLTGSISGASGTIYNLQGDTLDLELVYNPAELLAPETCVFGMSVADITISEVAE